MKLKFESNNINDYLASTKIIDWQTPAIIEKAKEITKDETTEIDKARCLYEWVRDEIPHSNDAGLSVVTCAASEVLSEGTGTCFSKSHLLVALLRSVNIPAGLCYQLLRLDPPVNNELILHGLSAIYLSNIEKWIRVDSRGNTCDINAQFKLDGEKLAFPIDTTAGERFYETVFVEPVSNVTEKLKGHNKIRDLWIDLPKSV